ncbi:hypothetical protein DM860_012181 [Cuscuta australis]|uniref:Uncharacterized protein n=1 Tax=Cuscuta australis TaxID=267555 RepID=A0A328E877_9ASTE|nr:hypothetical protein DM860_012181 [Cuscuta australis]
MEKGVVLRSKYEEQINDMPSFSLGITQILDGMDTAEQDMNVVNYTADITTEVAPESAVQVTSEDGRDATGKGLEINNQVAKEGDSAKGGMDSAKRSSMEELGARNVDIRVEDKNDVGEKHILEEIESVGQDIYVENISKQINAEIAPMSEVDVTPEKTKGTSDVAPLLRYHSIPECVYSY